MCTIPLGIYKCIQNLSTSIEILITWDCLICLQLKIIVLGDFCLSRLSDKQWLWYDFRNSDNIYISVVKKMDPDLKRVSKIPFYCIRNESSMLKILWQIYLYRYFRKKISLISRHLWKVKFFKLAWRGFK